MPLPQTNLKNSVFNTFGNYCCQVNFLPLFKLATENVFTNSLPCFELQKPEKTMNYNPLTLLNFNLTKTLLFIV